MGDASPACCRMLGLHPHAMASVCLIHDARPGALSSVAASLAWKTLMSGRRLRRKEAEAAVDVLGLQAFERTWDRVEPCLVADACLASSAGGR